MQRLKHDMAIAQPIQQFLLPKFRPQIAGFAVLAQKQLQRLTFVYTND